MPTSPSNQDRRPRHRRGASHICAVCGNAFPNRDILPATYVGHRAATAIAARVPGWSADSFICRGCLSRFRADLVRGAIEKDGGELNTLEQEVIKSLHAGEVLADNLNTEFDRGLTLGERMADRVADFGGSWRFIMVFFALMTVWIIINSVTLIWRPFDPYPYILLNLALSLLAAIQAPIIMMSQNRQESRDRLRAESDYKVNLKAELEIRAISERLDQLIHHQWMHLLEIQEIQMEMIDDLSARKPSG
jgi:uncharacterized membrane protein